MESNTDQSKKIHGSLETAHIEMEDLEPDSIVDLSSINKIIDLEITNQFSDDIQGREYKVQKAIENILDEESEA